MVDHAVRKGVKFDKPALGVTPQADASPCNGCLSSRRCLQFIT
ncbi:MAG TPA: hypothetical protein VIL39_02775 [Verrucomicrobiae bacterium]